MTDYKLVEDSLKPATLGRLQVSVGASFLQWSHLALFDQEKSRFKANSASEFAGWWSTEVDPTFGRLMCWIAFSVGAEYLGKGVCLLNGLNVKDKKEKPILAYPSSDEPIDGWAKKVFTGQGPKIVRPTYLTMDRLAHLFDSLAKNLKLGDKDRFLLVAGYKLLASSIRNRDAHFYTPGVREGHFYLVKKVFVPCFNVLVRCLPDSGNALGDWLHDAHGYIDGIFG